MRFTLSLASATLTSCALAGTPAVFCPGSNPYFANACSPNTLIAVTDNAAVLGVDLDYDTNAPAGWVVVVYLCTSGDVTVDAPGAAQDIKSLEIKAAGSPCASTVAAANLSLTGAIRDVRHIFQGAGLTTLDVRGTISGDLYDVEATSIDAGYQSANASGLIVDGDALGDISLGEWTNATDAVQISRLRVGDDLLGNVYAQDGAIDFISVVGDIGAANSPVDIRASTDVGIVAATNIHAEIEALDGNITSIEAGGGGDFTGLISADELAAPAHANPSYTIFTNAADRVINITGDFGTDTAEARIRLTEPLTNGTAMVGPQAISIGGSFVNSVAASNDPEIELPAGGLGGYIVINQPNTSGEWEEGATVSVGAIDLDGPNYILADLDELEEIGGASAGVAPFSLHRTLCVPQDDAFELLHVSPTCLLEDPSCIEVLECVVRLYEMRTVFRGPLVNINSPSPPQSAEGVVVIKKRTLGPSMLDWEEIDDIASEFEIAQQNGTGGGVRSEIAPSRINNAELGIGVEYRVTNALGEAPLLCDGVAGNPPAEFTYQFILDYDCAAGLVELFDLDEDGVVSYADLVAWLIIHEDLNLDGEADDLDFALLYAAITYYNSL